MMIIAKQLKLHIIPLMIGAMITLGGYEAVPAQDQTGCLFAWLRIGQAPLIRFTGTFYAPDDGLSLWLPSAGVQPRPADSCYQDSQQQYGFQS